MFNNDVGSGHFDPLNQPIKDYNSGRPYQIKSVTRSQMHNDQVSCGDVHVCAEQCEHTVW